MILTGNRVALYARFSSDNQRVESIDAQVRAMKAYCKQHNYLIVETYIDEAKSATNDRRPAFQKMIADSNKRIFDILLVHKLDRFARNRYDSAVYKRELKKNGVSVYSVLENLDDSPESIMLEAILEGMNEYYSQNLSRETMKGMRETALQGKHTGGIPALGYNVDPVTRKLVINEEEAEIVRLIFSMYASGHGYSAILDELHERHWLTKQKKEFGKNSLYSILTNPKYQGNYVFNRRSAKDIEGRRNNHFLKNSEEIIFIEGGCPQLVDIATFQKVQERLKENKRAGLRHTAKENYILSGKVYCKECGKSMVGATRLSGRNKSRYTTYRCPTRHHSCSNREINRDYLDAYVIALIEREILNPQSLKAIAQRIQNRAEKRSEDDSDAQEEIQTRINQISETIKNVTDGIIAAGVLSDTLAERLKTLEEEKAHLEIELLHASSSPIFEPIDTQWLLSEYANIKATPASPEYKFFIRNLIRRIEVGKYTVNITLKTGLEAYPELDTTYTVRRQTVYEAGKAL